MSEKEALGNESKNKLTHAFKEATFMVVTPISSVLAILFETLTNSRRSVDEINKACTDKGLPPAFPLTRDGTPEIPGNPDYRFEGFGVIIGLPPKLSFWVHYKPDSPDHVELGRFTVPIGLGRLASLNRLLG
ncbi:MAG: hypothetical protein ACRDEA_01295 [Microcystaceae cyanobacterium]